MAHQPILLHIGSTIAFSNKLRAQEPFAITPKHQPYDYEPNAWNPNIEYNVRNVLNVDRFGALEVCAGACW
jgi:hypothetical protein